MSVGAPAGDTAGVIVSGPSARQAKLVAALLATLGLLTLLGVLLALPAGIRAASPDGNISIVEGAYTPATLTIDQHATVFWHNDGTSKHSVIADDGSFDSGPLSPGDVFGNVFDVAGTFTYHDANDPSGMQGTIIVTPVAATPVPTGPTPPPGTLPPNFHTPVPIATDAPPTETPAASLIPIDGDGQGAGSTTLVVVGVLVVAFVLIAIRAVRRRR